MASVVSQEVKGKQVILSLKMSLKESKALQGCIENIHLVPEELATSCARIYERGKEGSSKYLLIPKKIREEVKLKKNVSCLKLDIKNKLILVYFMDKAKK